MELLKELIKFVEKESGKDVLTAEEKTRLEKEKASLEEEKQTIEKRLIEIKQRIREIDDRLNVKERETTKNLKLIVQVMKNIGVDPREIGIDETIAKKAEQKTKTGSRRGLRNLQLFVDNKPSQWGTLSRTLWYVSKNCKGKNENGSLCTEEFYRMIHGGFEAYKQGNWRVTLPNGITLEGRMIEEKE